mmetsp:Transcript_90809/g.211264  ORF Transcript_90809/g.211264 Transcript_90809/m.211264 type:complete len:213 (+) Transcript_90809:582-1220(+)
MMCERCTTCWCEPTVSRPFVCSPTTVGAVTACPLVRTWSRVCVGSLKAQCLEMCCSSTSQATAARRKIPPTRRRTAMMKRSAPRTSRWQAKLWTARSLTCSARRCRRASKSLPYSIAATVALVSTWPSLRQAAAGQRRKTPAIAPRMSSSSRGARMRSVPRMPLTATAHPQVLLPPRCAKHWREEALCSRTHSCCNASTRTCSSTATARGRN